MVPGATLRYGSHFWRVTRRPRLSSRQPMEAAATPFPREETTPPVTKIYFGPLRKFRKFLRSGVRTPHYEENRGACQIILRDPSARENFSIRRAPAESFPHGRHQPAHPR